MPDSATSPSLRELSEGATSGPWIRSGMGWNIIGQNGLGPAVSERRPQPEWADPYDPLPDAEFIVALVNAYRNGEMCRASDAEHYMRLAEKRREELRSLEATVAEREARARAEGPGWQPMETAPKDWTAVLLTVPRRDSTEPHLVGEAYFDPEADGGSWWWAGTRSNEYFDTSINDGNEPPIAWMPMPTPALIPEARHER